MIAQIFLKLYNFWLKIIACNPVLVSELFPRTHAIRHPPNIPHLCRHHALTLAAQEGGVKTIFSPNCKLVG